MAAIGFVVGVAWPRLAGVRLGPSVPEAPSAAIAPASSADPGAPSAAPSSEPAAAVAPLASSVPSALPTAPSSVVATPSHGSVFACKSADGESFRSGECGGLWGLDGIVMPRLRKLGDCPAAAGFTGSIHFVLHVDFEHGVSVELGRGHAAPAPEVLSCAKAAMSGINVAGIAHDKPRYSVVYAVAFAPDAAPSTASTEPATPAAPAHDASPQSAEVQWEAAIVRDQPKTGKIVARLPRGTVLHLGIIKDGWYPIKYGDAFGSDGWVYRGAIGR
jgi:hypothetical protein